MFLDLGRGSSFRGDGGAHRKCSFILKPAGGGSSISWMQKPKKKMTLRRRYDVTLSEALNFTTLRELACPSLRAQFNSTPPFSVETPRLLRHHEYVMDGERKFELITALNDSVWLRVWR